MNIGPLLGAVGRLRQLHENQRLVALAETAWGRVGVGVVATALLIPFDIAPFAIPALVLILWRPTHRRTILSLTALAVAGVTVADRLGASPASSPTVLLTWSLALTTLLALLFACFLAAQNFRRLPALIRHAPQLFLHLVFWGLLGLVWWLNDAQGHFLRVLTLVTTLLPFLLWRCGYMLKTGQRGKVDGIRFRDHFFYLFPAFGGTNVPYGKGLGYLSGHESKPTQGFARTQLAGIKLLILAWLAKGGLKLMNALVFGTPDSTLSHLLPGVHLGVPTAFEMMRSGADFAVPLMWIGLYAELIRMTLWIGSIGHVYIGCLRLFGFSVFRNTYKPLLSETLLDFWNRFYYYFKELLVEFFFFPTYLRYFKKWPTMRMLAAVFAAAFVGNIYYHVLFEVEALLAGDFANITQMLESYLLYSFLLSSGVALSMLRQQKQRAGRSAEAAGSLTRLRRIAGVWTFYSLIHVWDSHVQLPFLDRTRFFLSLFGLEGLLPPV